MAFNLNVLEAITVTLDTTWPPGTRVHDYLARIEDTYVDHNWQITFTLPSNAWSSGQTVVWLAPFGVDQPLTLNPRSTTQTFLGDVTRDVMPAVNGTQVMPQSLYVAKGSEVAFKLGKPKTGQWRAYLIDSTGHPVNGKVPHSGWYDVVLTASGMEGPENFRLDATYLGAQKI